ncbi:unnamed protein product, partial [Ixodes persulcatus]
HSTRLIIAISQGEQNRAQRDPRPPLSPRPRPLGRHPKSEEGRPLSPHEYEQGVPASPGPAPSPPRASPARPASPTLSPVVAGDRCGGVGTPPQRRPGLRRRQRHSVAVRRPTTPPPPRKCRPTGSSGDSDTGVKEETEEERAV